MARPTLYSDELAERVCEVISTSSRGLNHLCAAEDMPAASTVYSWLARYPEFLEKYLRAREVQSHVLMDECVDISDNDAFDTIETEKGDIPNKEWMLRSKLRVDTRLRIAGKLNPKRYGDMIKHAGADGGNLNIVVSSEDAAL